MHLHFSFLFKQVQFCVAVPDLPKGTTFRSNNAPFLPCNQQIQSPYTLLLLSKPTFKTRLKANLVVLVKNIVIGCILQTYWTSCGLQCAFEQSSLYRSLLLNRKYVWAGERRGCVGLFLWETLAKGKMFMSCFSLYRRSERSGSTLPWQWI